MVKVLVLNLIFFLNVLGALPLEISLEHAVTQEEKAHGLMERKTMSDNHGMLFHYSIPTVVTMWMYKTWLDLDIAFLDENKNIREIHSMKATPEVNDPKYFILKSITPCEPISYVLEMHQGWFTKNGIDQGDHLQCEGTSAHGYFYKAERK